MRFQWIYGYVVLGGIEELPHLIARWKISRIVIVADLRPESRITMLEIAGQKGVRVSEWYPAEHEIAMASQPKNIAENVTL